MTPPLVGTSEAAGLMLEFRFEGGRAVLCGAVGASESLCDGVNVDSSSVKRNGSHLERVQGLKVELPVANSFANSFTGEASPGLG